MADRLLTYRTAAGLMNLDARAFRARVDRGSIPRGLLYDRVRAGGKRPERFVLADPFIAWVGGQVDSTTDLLLAHDKRGDGE